MTRHSEEISPDGPRALSVEEHLSVIARATRAALCDLSEAENEKYINLAGFLWHLVARPQEPGKVTAIFRSVGNAIADEYGMRPDANDINFLGKPIESMSKEELIEVVRQLDWHIAQLGKVLKP